MSADLVSYLATKGVRTFRAAGPEITAHCWWCPDGNPKGKGKLYLNTETWAYHCKRCTVSGGQRQLMEHYGDELEAREYLPGTDPALRRQVLEAATEMAGEWLLSNPAVLTYLTGRGLTEATIVNARLGYVPGAWGLGRELRPQHAFADIKAAGLMTAEGQEFFAGHILIPYISHGQPVQLRGRSYVPGKAPTGAKYVTPQGENARLYNSDSLHGADQAIVVEGELDALVLQQALSRADDPKLRTTAVVAIAGAETFPDRFASYFDTCRRVYIGFDPDSPGRAGAEKAATLIGSKARVLRLPEDLPSCDWTDYLQPKGLGVHAGHTWRDVAALMNAADSVGRTLYTAMDALAQWQRIDRQIGGILTGIEGLDRYIAPGLKPGQMMIPLARTGVGKSAFLASLTYNLRERPQLIVSLELTAAEYWDRLMRIGRFYNPLATEEEVALSFAKTRIFDRRIKPGELMRLADEFAEDVGEPPQVIGLDYIGYASGAYAGNSQYERTTRAVMALKEDAKAIGAAMIAPHQAGRTAAGGVPVKAEDARDSGAIEDTADILLGLFNPSEADVATGFTGQVNCTILKNRNGRKNVGIPLLFSMMSLVMVEKASPSGIVVEDENRLILSGETYAKALEYRRANARQSGYRQQMLGARP